MDSFSEKKNNICGIDESVGDLCQNDLGEIQRIFRVGWIKDIIDDTTDFLFVTAQSDATYICNEQNSKMILKKEKLLS